MQAGFSVFTMGLLRTIAVILGVAILFAAPVPCEAQDKPTLTVIEELYFGSFALIDNDRPYSIIVGADGGVTYDNAIVGVVEPRRGEYLIEGMPPGTVIDVQIRGDGFLTSQDGDDGPPFIVTDYATSEVVADAEGRAVLYVGGTLKSTGNANANYNSGSYSGKIDMVLNFDITDPLEGDSFGDVP